MANTPIDLFNALRDAENSPGLLLEIEENQASKTSESVVNLVQTIIKKDGDKEIVEKEHEIKINLMYQHWIGLFINEVASNKIVTNANRFTNLFIQDGIETEFMEQGDIIFMYLPKSNIDDPQSVDDIQSFNIELIQQYKSDVPVDQLKTCLIKFSKKKLPDGDEKFSFAIVEQHRRIIDLIENVKKHSGDIAEVEKSTEQVHRVIAVGEYFMENKDQNHTILHYTLKSALDINNTTNFFNIREKDSFFIHCLNPKMNASSMNDFISTETKSSEKIFGSHKFSPCTNDMLRILDCKMVWIHSSNVDIEKLLNRIDDPTKETFDSE